MMRVARSFTDVEALRNYPSIIWDCLAEGETFDDNAKANLPWPEYPMDDYLD